MSLRTFINLNSEHPPLEWVLSVYLNTSILCLIIQGFSLIRIKFYRNPSSPLFHYHAIIQQMISDFFHVIFKFLAFFNGGAFLHYSQNLLVPVSTKICT